MHAGLFYRLNFDAAGLKVYFGNGPRRNAGAHCCYSSRPVGASGRAIGSEECSKTHISLDVPGGHSPTVSEQLF